MRGGRWPPATVKSLRAAVENLHAEETAAQPLSKSKSRGVRSPEADIARRPSSITATAMTRSVTIARELGIDRETVGRCLRLAKPVISTAGFEEASEVKPTIWITGNGVGRKSQCEALAEVIMAKARSGGEFLRLLKIEPQRPFTVNVFTGVKSGEEDP